MHCAILPRLTQGLFLTPTLSYALQFAYALRALVINEFRSPQWTQRVLGVPGASTMGQAALISFDFYTDEAWIGIGIAFL
jgi:hypothetical protein